MTINEWFLTLSKSLLKYHGDCRIWSTPIQGLFSNIRLRLPLVLLLSFDEQPKGRLLLVKLVWFHGTSPKKKDLVSSWWPRAGHWNWPPNHPRHSAVPSEKHHFFLPMSPARKSFLSSSPNCMAQTFGTRLCFEAGIVFSPGSLIWNFRSSVSSILSWFDLMFRDLGVRTH